MPQPKPALLFDQAGGRLGVAPVVRVGERRSEVSQRSGRIDGRQLAPSQPGLEFVHAEPRRRSLPHLVRVHAVMLAERPMKTSDVLDPSVGTTLQVTWVFRGAKNYRDTTNAAVTSTATLPFSTMCAFSLSFAFP